MAKSKINWENEKENLIELLNSGHSYRSIAKIYSVDKSTIKNTIIQLKIENYYLRKHFTDIITKNELEELLITKRLKKSEVMSIYNISLKTLNSAIDKFNIDLSKIYNNWTYEEIVSLLNNGHSISKIAKIYRVRYSVIKDYINSNITTKNDNSSTTITGKKDTKELSLLYFPLVQTINSSKNRRKYYYVSESGTWMRKGDLIRYLELRNISFDEWENKWIFRLREDQLYSDIWIEKKIDYYYSDKLQYTKDYIRDSLKKDRNFKCNFFLVKEDLIKSFLTNSRNSEFFYDFSKIPNIIKTKKIKFKVLVKSYTNFSEIEWNTNYEELVEKNFNYKPIIKSIGEEHIKFYLKNVLYIKDISALVNKTIYGISGRNKNYVIIDFTIIYNKYNIWIEYNGKQHYEYSRFFHKSIKDFDNQLKRDQNIRDYCKENNILLIEVPYILDTYEKVKDFLDKVILQGIDPNTLIDYKSLYKIN